MKVYSLTIDGSLSLHEKHDEVNITAKYIWVREGSFKITMKDSTPYTGKVNIILEGNEKKPQFYVDDKIEIDNKLFLVTGSLIFLGMPPKTIQTYLTKFAYKNDFEIFVQEAQNWKESDEIVIGPSFQYGNQGEKCLILKIEDDSFGKKIQCKNPLEYDHFGAENPTVTSDDNFDSLKIDQKFGGSVDMRACVGHLTRNIKIFANEGNGGRFLIYNYLVLNHLDNPILNMTGITHLKGIEMINMG